jgi:hypothetical protein
VLILRTINSHNRRLVAIVDASLKTLVACLDLGLVETLARIAILTEDNALPDSEKVQRIRALLSTQEAKRLLEKDNLAGLKEALVNELGDDEYYAILAAKSMRIQNRISPILKALTFLGEPSAHELQTAIDHFKSKDGIIDKAPHRVLAELDEALSCQYGITNANIHEGKNPYINFKNTGFSLSTPTQEASDAEPLQQFFPERRYSDLGQYPGRHTTRVNCLTQRSAD